MIRATAYFFYDSYAYIITVIREAFGLVFEGSCLVLLSVLLLHIGMTNILATALFTSSLHHIFSFSFPIRKPRDDKAKRSFASTSKNKIFQSN